MVKEEIEEERSEGDTIREKVNWNEQCIEELISHGIMSQEVKEREGL